MKKASFKVGDTITVKLKDATSHIIYTHKNVQVKSIDMKCINGRIDFVIKILDPKLDKILWFNEPFTIFLSNVTSFRVHRSLHLVPLELTRDPHPDPIRRKNAEIKMEKFLK